LRLLGLVGAVVVSFLVGLSLGGLIMAARGTANSGLGPAVRASFVNGTPMTSSALKRILMTPRVGIVTPMAMEMAPLLASMKLTAVVNCSGYSFYVGSIGGTPVVLVRSGEKEYAAVEATTLMDTLFNVRAAILSGTAGSRNPYVVPGDVVIGAFVVDKSSIHYHRASLVNSTMAYSETPYGVEVVNVTPLRGDLVSGFGEAMPSYSNASSYGYGYGIDLSYVYVEYLAASAQLVELAGQAASTLSPVPLANVTGLNVSGELVPRIIVGVIGSANQWTEPLSWMAQQNALYETDAGENEGMGFAYVNSRLGVPWVIVRGISDSPWFPSVYIGPTAAEEAANVTIYIVEHLNLSNVSDAPATFSMLSNVSNAAIHGYIVAARAYYLGLKVIGISYVNQQGQMVNESGPAFEEEYYSEYSYSTAMKYLLAANRVIG